MSLLRSRRLLPLLTTQTLGAINDNLFKNALVVLVLFRATTGGPTLVAAVGGVFILPYVLLSAAAGQVADRFEKSRTIVWVKLWELGLMALAAAAFLIDSTPMLFAVLFGLGMQATMFGPLKYGILPSHLAENELLRGNGLVEAGTFLGILAGTIAGSALIALPNGAVIVSATGLAVAAAGVASAMMIPRAEPGDPALRIGWNPIPETIHLLATARANRPVWLCLLGISWFWVVGAILLTELPTLVRDDLHAQPQVVSLMLACFSIGVGAGSLLCARLLGGEVTARYVPFAALGLSVFIWDFGRSVHGAEGLGTIAAVVSTLPGWRMLADLGLLSTCGGLYSVPLYAIIQERSAPSHRARMISANNVVNALGMVTASIVIALLAAVGVAPVTILLLTATANLAVAAWIVRLLPQETVRAIFRWYFMTFHGVTVTGLEHLKAAGDRVVIAVNHQSFLDGCFVAAFLPGAPVFAVDIQTARHWWVRLFLAAVKTFLVDPANPFATKAMVQVVRSGQRLVVFPEGRITTTGALMKVYEGAGMVADKARAAIIPVRIDGLQFTPLSRMKGKAPRQWFPHLSMTMLPPVTVTHDAGLPSRQRRHAIGVVLQGVMEQAGFTTAATGRPLFRALLDARHRFGGGTPIIEDIARRPLTYDRVVLGAVVLGRALAALAPEGGHVGIMLPNASAAAVTFFALQAWGRVPAMLNFSAGAEGMLAACAAAEVTIVLTSRAFIEKAKLEAVIARMAGQVRFVWLEDVRAGLGAAAKLRGWVDAKRAGRLPGARRPADAPAAVLFTSGSEGQPKGVVLSHRNLLANIAQAAAVVDFTAADRVFNAMPMFHSFGLTAGTLLPMLSGVRAFFYPSPLHYRTVPEMIYQTDSTIAFGSDTFLSGWARFAHPYDFYRMRYIFAGAERLRPETRQLYAERFGVRVLEGYGVTETAPVLALNTPMHSRPGTAGRLVPGMSYRLDPVEGIAQGGRLVVRGPNVMLGYLRSSAPGVLETLPGGWYDTGDVCTVDAEGFVTIVARAKRFAKIGGEMVSMPAAEIRAAALWPDATHVVVAVPDSRKGEALVLLTTQPGASSRALLEQARAQGSPEIAVPRDVRVVETLPLLGSGKVDYPAATRLAAEQISGSSAADPAAHCHADEEELVRTDD